MLWWNTMRLFAIARHEFLWRTFQHADPIKWPTHMDAIKQVYGY